jgi:hypothetical protein
METKLALFMGEGCRRKESLSTEGEGYRKKESLSTDGEGYRRKESLSTEGEGYRKKESLSTDGEGYRRKENTDVGRRPNTSSNKSLFLGKREHWNSFEGKCPLTTDKIVLPRNTLYINL